MITWNPEPLWETFDRLRTVPQVRANDTLGLVLTEAARVRASVRRGYRSLDMLRGQLRQGERNVIIRLR